jgi:hypothetical protein
VRNNAGNREVLEAGANRSEAKVPVVVRVHRRRSIGPGLGVVGMCPGVAVVEFYKSYYLKSIKIYVPEKPE